MNCTWSAPPGDWQAGALCLHSSLGKGSPWNSSSPGILGALRKAIQLLWYQRKFQTGMQRCGSWGGKMPSVVRMVPAWQGPQKWIKGIQAVHAEHLAGLGQHCTYRLTDGCEGGQTRGCPCEGWQAFSEQGEKLVGRVTLKPTSSPPGQTKPPELSKLETQEGRQPRGWCRRLPLTDVPGPVLTVTQHACPSQTLLLQD